MNATLVLEVISGVPDVVLLTIDPEASHAAWESCVKENYPSFNAEEIAEMGLSDAELERDCLYDETLGLYFYLAETGKTTMSICTMSK